MTRLHASVIFALVYFVCRNLATIPAGVAKLPHCVETDKDVGFILVSTLDGKLTSIGSAGNVLWERDAGPGPLLTSNIHNIELANNGERIRIIPSLTGSLYKFNGKIIDAIPIDVDHLLKSSFLYSSNLVIAGSRDVRTYGILAKTGQSIYECTTDGCKNITRVEDEFEDIVLVERSTTTIRAHEPRTGIERWNFSVGHHNIRIPQASCVNYDDEITSLNITAEVPRGLLKALRTGSSEVVWQHLFGAPIVRVWKWDGGNLIPIDLFTQPLDSLSPAIYLGMHDKQLYISESTRMINSLSSTAMTDFKMRIPWKPIAATTRIDNGLDDKTALSVLDSSDYIDGQGYYFYTENDIAKQNTILCGTNTTRKDFTARELFNWKIILMSFIFVFAAHEFWNYRLRVFQRRTNATETLPTTINTNILEIAEPVTTFTSRFTNDYDIISCLGKGGFGVVFEVEQKLIKFRYAVKRITQPDDSTKVLREVETLAHLDHINIVRYFTCWKESPPTNWIDEFNKKWKLNDDLSTYGTESYVSTKCKSHRRSNSTVITMDEATDGDSYIQFEAGSTDEVVNDISESILSEDTEIKKSASTSYLYIQMQLCRKDCLKDWLLTNYHRDRSKILEIYNQILDAVVYVHTQRLIHRDLKPGNIFFSHDMCIKVGDFGLATPMIHPETNAEGNESSGHTKGAGTTFYMSPEQKERREYNYKVDIFSLGVILFELLVPVSTESERIHKLTDLGRGKFPDNFSKDNPTEYKLLTKMLSKEPNKRPDAHEVRASLNENCNKTLSLPVDIVL